MGRGVAATVGDVGTCMTLWRIFVLAQVGAH